MCICLRGERLIGVSGLSHPWLSFGERCAMCLTLSGTVWVQLPLNAASKPAFAECFSPHVLALFTNPPLLLLYLLPLLLLHPSSSLLCFSRSLLPSRPSHLTVSSILLYSLSSVSACLPLWYRARLNFDLCEDCSSQRSMESMVKDRNMEAGEAVCHILYQEGPKVLVCVLPVF